jgi:hypothetical protein
LQHVSYLSVDHWLQKEHLEQDKVVRTLLEIERVLKLSPLQQHIRATPQTYEARIQKGICLYKEGLCLYSEAPEPYSLPLNSTQHLPLPLRQVWTKWEGKINPEHLANFIKEAKLFKPEKVIKTLLYTAQQFNLSSDLEADPNADYYGIQIKGGQISLYKKTFCRKLFLHLTTDQAFHISEQSILTDPQEQLLKYATEAGYKKKKIAAEWPTLLNLASQVKIENMLCLLKNSVKSDYFPLLNTFVYMGQQLSSQIFYAKKLKTLLILGLLF